YVHDRLTLTTTLESVNSSGVLANSASTLGSISPDGRFITFTTAASNFGTGGLPGIQQVFIRDRQTGTGEIVSVNDAGQPASLHAFAADITPEGRFVTFWSLAENLVMPDDNGRSDVFYRD